MAAVEKKGTKSTASSLRKTKNIIYHQIKVANCAKLLIQYLPKAQMLDLEVRVQLVLPLGHIVALYARKLAL